MISISTWGAASRHCRPYHRLSTYATTCWWYTSSNLCWETKLHHNLSSVQSPQFVQKYSQTFVLLAEHHYLQTQSDVIITTSFQSLFESK